MATVVCGVGLAWRGAAGATGEMAVSPIATADDAEDASVRSRASAESTVAVRESLPHAASTADRHSAATTVARPVMSGRAARPPEAKP